MLVLPHNTVALRPTAGGSLPSTRYSWCPSQSRQDVVV